MGGIAWAEFLKPNQHTVDAYQFEADEDDDEWENTLTELIGCPYCTAEPAAPACLNAKERTMRQGIVAMTNMVDDEAYTGKLDVLIRKRMRAPEDEGPIDKARRENEACHAYAQLVEDEKKACEAAVKKARVPENPKIEGD